jgi:hypothetical protein
MLKQQPEKLLTFHPARFGDTTLTVLVTKRDVGAIVGNDMFLAYYTPV